MLPAKGRNKRMSSIRSKNTSIDLTMAKLLKEAGISFIRYPKIECNPDFAIREDRIAIFCDGDFWHGWNWTRLKLKLKNDFWVSKIRNTIKRDRKADKILRGKGWKVVRLWEHDIKQRPEKCLELVKDNMEDRP